MDRSNHRPKETTENAWWGGARRRWDDTPTPDRIKALLPIIVLILLILAFLGGSWYRDKTDPHTVNSLQKALVEAEKGKLFEKRRADSAVVSAEANQEAAIIWRSRAEGTWGLRKHTNEKLILDSLKGYTYSHLDSMLWSRYDSVPR